MIVVLDTNVIISALLSPKGPPAEVVRRWQADEFDVVTSPALTAEFERALTYPEVNKYLKLPQEEVSRLLKRFQTTAVVVAPQITLDVVREDPADNRVLECALAGEAAYVVTGDKHILKLKTYEHLEIVNPVGFLAALEFEKRGR